MDASVKWINDYLDPPATADEQGALLTDAGFPLEGTTEVALESGERDICQDFEMTSNRGDCICHVGLAREIAAFSGRSLKLPEVRNTPGGTKASKFISVENREPDRCPLYTARVIRGAKVGPSPDWLAERLRAIGQIPRNNVVDVTNYVLYELGQPTHVFDLAKIKGGRIIIRMAKDKEPFLPIGEGEKEIALSTNDLVIADAEDAVAIGGVKGGAHSAVTESTTDLLIEAATFHPVTVRETSRRLKVDSGSSYRYERGVHAAHVNPAAERLVQLILETAGGELCEGVVSDGAEIPALAEARMRPARCRQLLGVDISDEQMMDHLDRLGFSPKKDGGEIVCTAPAHRLDIEREVDLIEEVGRMFGHSNIPIVDTIPIRVAPLQPRQQARRAMNDALVGMGFVETVTHSLISDAMAKPFLSPGESTLAVDDDRAKKEPILRPSIVPSVLRVRAHNAAQGVNNLRLFEAGATWAVGKAGQHHETRRCALVADIDDRSLGVRPLRGVIDRLAELLAGPDARVDLTPCDDIQWMRDGAQARITLDGRDVGVIGILDKAVASQFDLDVDVAAAEVELEHLFDAYPPEREVAALPAFPAIERDLSAIVAEDVRWADVQAAIDDLSLEAIDGVSFVTAFRGKPIPSGRKSITVRLRFRSDDRTLTHDEVDPQMNRAVDALVKKLDAEIRS